MAKRYSELEDDLQNSIGLELDALESSFEAARRSEVKPTNKAFFGMCASCKGFSYAETEFGVLVAFCKRFKIKRKAGSVVKTCYEYEQRGQMDLYEMREIAYLIEPVKDKLGF